MESESAGSAASFAPFSRLPAELRHAIWMASLSDWAAVKVATHADSVQLHPLGWDVAQVGQACGEARHAMQGYFARVRQSASKGFHWVNFETTIFHLGPANAAREAIGALGGLGLTQVRHIAITWTSFYNITRCFGLLSVACPLLRTIVVLAGGSWNPHARMISGDDLGLVVCAIEKGVPDSDAQPLDVSRFNTISRAWFSNHQQHVKVVLLRLRWPAHETGLEG